MSCQCCDKDKTIDDLRDELDDLKGEIQVAQRDLEAAEDEIEAHRYVVLRIEGLVRNRMRERRNESDPFLASLLREIESV